MLTPLEEYVMVEGGTEAPFSGEYVDLFEDGTYHCKRCGAALFSSDAKIHSNTGWPSFDYTLKDAVERRPDEDGSRTEIVCANCGAHLGHVFEGEGFTSADTRHCVNSVALDFEPEADDERAIFAGGCFWGVEYQLDQLEGVLQTTAGYTGGHLESPGYEDVCSGGTGHAEAVEVVFDPSVITFEELAKSFFEIHDPTTPNRQGADVGSQYRSAVFYTSEEQRVVTEELIDRLEGSGFDVVTEVAPAGEFWPAEDYHQDYYEKSGAGSHCHVRVDKFGD
ncbi:bifunctional methionine sulfoxide reductase B/A protein [Candidatus Fermentibacteria bacterium]|nr:bifunctional methionine sulfoxide reductase B/A protein [Candidatus Fermentibacteria bacterium]